MNFTLISICVLLLMLGTIEARQREKRPKDKIIPTERPQSPNVCDNPDRDSKVHCYCERTNAIKNVSSAECWVFNGGIPIDDSIWDAFQSQNRLQDLSFNVRSDGGLSYVPTRALRYLRKLRNLTITYASIDEVYSFAFANLTSLKEVTVSKNKIVILEPNAFAHMTNLTTLTMDDNRIAEIGKNTFVDLPVLQKLFMTNNNISVIHDGAFKELIQLLELDLDKNSIVNLNKDTFYGLANLKKLDLRSNRMKVLSDFTFAELWNLQELYLDENELKFISERAFDGLSQMKKLSLSSNRLTALTGGLFEGVRSVSILNMRDNILQTFTLDDVRPILDNLKNATSLLLLDGNNFVCDCRLSWIHQLRNETKNDKTRISLEQITCSVDDHHLRESLLKHKSMDLNLDNQLNQQDKATHRVFSQRTSVEYVDPDKYNRDSANNFDDLDAFDDLDIQKDSTGNSQNNHTRRGSNHKHLFQIPVELLPCPEELKDSTDAPLLRPSRGEVKDFRNQMPSSSEASSSDSVVVNSLLVAVVSLVSVSL